MVPRFLSPADWLGAIEAMPRLSAVAVLVVSLSMLAFGLRGFRYYVCLGAALGGWMGGVALGRLMHVTGWYVGLPVALIAVAAIWPVARFAAPLVIGFVAGSCAGTLVAEGFEVDAFWLSFAGGLFVGVLLAVLAARFAVALFSAAWGTLGVAVSLGAAVRASSGWFSPGGYVAYPLVSIVGGAMLLVISIIVQVTLDPELPAAPSGDGQSQ